MSILDTKDINIPEIEDMGNISPDQLPKIIKEQYSNLQILEDKVQQVIEKAEKTKEKAEKADVEMGFFKSSKKEAISLLQDAVKGMADSQLSAAEAQQISFEYQAKMAKIMKFLFALGTSSIAMNRVATKEITERLKNASEGEISDLAKQELNDVLLQLKAQEDIFLQNEKMKQKMKEQDQRIEILEKSIKNQKRKQKKQNTIVKNEKEIENIKLEKPKSKKVAGILAILFGYFGVQWFYLGKPVRAIIYIAVYIVFPFIWLLYIAEGIFFLCAKQETFDKYRSKFKYW